MREGRRRKEEVIQEEEVESQVATHLCFARDSPGTLDPSSSVRNQGGGGLEGKEGTLESEGGRDGYM